MPIGNADTVVRCSFLFCLLHSTPVEPFGISRLYLNCLISCLFSVTFQVDCNIYTDTVFRKGVWYITV